MKRLFITLVATLLVAIALPAQENVFDKYADSEGVSTVYQIKNAAGELEALGTGDLEGDVDAIVDDRIATDG